MCSAASGRRVDSGAIAAGGTVRPTAAMDADGVVACLMSVPGTVTSPCDSSPKSGNRLLVSIEERSIAPAVATMRDEEIASLLERTSRTFALAIPLLDEPLRRRVGLAYLLFRIADTLEDAELWDRDQRLVALRSFEQWLGGGRGEWAHASPPTKDPACLELLDRADAVLAEVADTERGHVRRTAHGMAEFVARQDERGAIQLADLADLRAYCYVVAGIVGEL